MDIRLRKLIKNHKDKIKSGSMLDTYNQKIIKDISCTITTRVNASNEIYVAIERKNMEQLRIRKLTPLECLKLQGFSEEDYNAIKERFSDSAIYHVAGDSISVSTLMCGVFGTMTNLDYRKATQDYVETLKGDYEQ